MVPSVYSESKTSNKGSDSTCWYELFGKSHRKIKTINRVLSSLLCVSSTENASKGGDAIFGKHTREQEDPNNNPDASGGDFAGISRYMDFLGR